MTATPITRRTVAVGMGLLIGAPAIVRSASLMPLRGIVLPNERPHAGFVDRLRYHLMDRVLTAGWTPEAARPFGGMGEAEMRRAVARARRDGFLT